MRNNPPKVLIVQKTVTHYREAFYERLFELLKDKSIDLELHYGVPRSGFGRTVHYGKPFHIKLFFDKLFWFPILSKILGADLIIVEHSNKFLINYLLFIGQFLGGPKLAFWGHGRNHQTDKPNSLGERFKRWMSRRVHWYFAYTGGVRNELIENGLDPDRITDVQNAVAAPSDAPSPSAIEDIKRELGLSEESVVGFFCSQMYTRKRLDMLVAAAVLVREKIPDFRLILAGAGMSQNIPEEADRDHDFIHYVGPQFGDRKSAYYSLARFVALPGVLGLGLVESFHYGVPSVVAENRFHGPEFSYLVDGENALLTGYGVSEFAQGIVRICQDDQLHAALKSGCERWSAVFTVDEMAKRFAGGIEGALAEQVSTRSYVA